MLKPMWWDDGCLHFIDQRLLPNEEVILQANTCAAVENAIRDMVVRGAPAIGISAAYGFVLAWREFADQPQAFSDAIDKLAMARPTAVNLLHGIKAMQKALRRFQNAGADNAQITALLLTEALAYHETDIAMNLEIGERGREAILDICDKDESAALNIITYCNAGSLATGGHGTALGVIRTLHKKKNIGMVYACETRPFLQGARLTAYELQKENIPYTLIADNMAAWLMQTAEIDAIVVGADRIASNGDTANKIGTYTLAIAAARHNIPLFIAAPTSTIDYDIENGSQIPVEHRAQEELLGYGDLRWTPEKTNTWNPAFDVTDHSLIKAIVTENDVLFPQKEGFRLSQSTQI